MMTHTRSSSTTRTTATLPTTLPNTTQHRRFSLMPPHNFDGQFWLLTCALLVFWSAVLISAAPSNEVKSTASAAATYADPSSPQEQRNQKSCKSLCEHCGGRDFYCGEECICECNEDNGADTECIAVMQSNARKLSIPFELLIQGPSSNRFVRNALQFEQRVVERQQTAAALKQLRNRRSTVVIYKPANQNTISATANKITLSGAKEKSIEKRQIDTSATASKHRSRRSVNQPDWFSDFANTLVRPAPLRAPRKAEAQSSKRAAETTRTRSSSVGSNLDRSWFAENPNLLLKPSPIFKRRATDTAADAVTSIGDESERLYDGAMRAMEKLPQILHDTISNIQDATMTEEMRGALRSKIREGAEKMQELTDNSLDVFRENKRADFADTFKNMGPSFEMFVPTMAPATVMPPQSMPAMNLPWFRPMRFLERVHQAIN